VDRRRLAGEVRYQASDFRLRVRVGERRLGCEVRGKVCYVGLRVAVRAERDGDVHTVAGGHVQEREADARALDQVQRAAGSDRRAVVLNRERERAGDDIGGNVRVRGQVARGKLRASRGAARESTVTLV
jgi:hypothetical protein